MKNLLTDRAVKIGYRIKQRRKELSMSQEKLLEALRDAGVGMSKPTLGKIEKGALGDFSVSQALALCEVLSCDIGYLLCEYDSKTIIVEKMTEHTGLSEAAIETLHALKTGEGMYVMDRMIKHHLITFVDGLLCSPDTVDKLSAKLNLYIALSNMIRNTRVETDERTKAMQAGALFETLHVITNYLEQTFSPTI